MKSFRKGASSRSDASKVRSKGDDDEDGDEYNTQSPSRSPSSSSRVRDRKFDRPDSSAPPSPENAGYPGYLTTEQKSVLYQFTREVKKRGGRQAVLCFGENEPEEFALCRFLRARKFVMEDCKDMLHQAMAMHAEPRSHHYYRKAEEALGVDEAIFKTQYPQVFSGHAKNGCPLFISKTGAINVNGLDCVTSVDQMHSYQWHFMVHIAGQKFRERQTADPAFHRFQTFCIFDLEGLSRQTINATVLGLIRHQTYVDSLCFPETLNKLLVINSPAFFSATWQIIKRWLDPYTASKIEIYSNRSRWEERFKELVDIDQIPCDYGGNALSVADLVFQSCPTNTGVTRRVTELLCLSKNKGQVTLCLQKGESMDIIVYTRSVVGADFSCTITNNDGEEDATRKNSEPGTSGTHHVRAEESTTTKRVNFARESIATGLVGPGTFTVSGCPNSKKTSKRFLFSTPNEYYLIVGNITKKLDPIVWTGRVFHVPVSVRVKEGGC